MPGFGEWTGLLPLVFVDKTVENVDNSLKNYYDSELCNSCSYLHGFENLTCLAVFRNDFKENLRHDFFSKTLSRARP